MIPFQILWAYMPRSWCLCYPQIPWRIFLLSASPSSVKGEWMEQLVEVCKQHMLVCVCGTPGPVCWSSGAGWSSLPRIHARSQFPYPSWTESGVLCLGCRVKVRECIPRILRCPCFVQLSKLSCPCSTGEAFWGFLRDRGQLLCPPCPFIPSLGAALFLCGFT